jgi:hypothetical protein
MLRKYPSASLPQSARVPHVSVCQKLASDSVTPSNLKEQPLPPQELQWCREAFHLFLVLHPHLLVVCRITTQGGAGLSPVTLSIKIPRFGHLHKKPRIFTNTSGRRSLQGSPLLLVFSWALHIHGGSHSGCP